MATRTTEPHRPEAVSREFSSPRVVSREGPPFPSLEKLFFSTMEGRKEAQDRTGQDRTGETRAASEIGQASALAKYSYSKDGK